ncbi:MAG: Gfo/Idh/MocA family oxidoreductase [Nitrospira sp.]|nr:MAG: Gfo/Idh/MocA family oxidoreductase [Nitrospira sp.]
MHLDDTAKSLTRVAVIGIGEHAETKLLPAIRAVSKLWLVAVSSRDAIKAKRILDRHPGISIHASHTDEALYESADLIVAAGPPQFNQKIIDAALRRNKHVLCEKPLATDRSTLAHLLGVAETAGSAITAVGLNLRFSATIRELIARGEHDPIAAIHIEYATTKPVTVAWGALNVAASCTLWHAIHVIDLAQSFLGPIRLSQIRQMELDEPGIAIEVQLQGNRCCGSILLHNCAPAFSLTIRTMHRSGTIATLTDLKSLTLSKPKHISATSSLYREQPRSYSLGTLADDIDSAGYRTMFAHIAHSIETGVQPLTSFQNTASAHTLLFELIDAVSLDPGNEREA